MVHELLVWLGLLPNSLFTCFVLFWWKVSWYASGMFLFKERENVGVICRVSTASAWGNVMSGSHQIISVLLRH